MFIVTEYAALKSKLYEIWVNSFMRQIIILVISLNKEIRKETNLCHGLGRHLEVTLI